MEFEIRYVPHFFGEEVKRRFSNKTGWLTAGSFYFSKPLKIGGITSA